MRFILKVKNGKLHLFEDKMFDDDLGELHKTFGGKLETRNILSTNYTLEDISGVFSNGQKYKITSNKGLKGILKKVTFSDDRYDFTAN